MASNYSSEIKKHTWTENYPPPLHHPPAKSHAEFLNFKIHHKGLNVTTQNSLSIIPTENIPIKKTPEWKIQSSPSLKIPVCDKRRL